MDAITAIEQGRGWGAMATIAIAAFLPLAIRLVLEVGAHRAWRRARRRLGPALSGLPQPLDEGEPKTVAGVLRVKRDLAGDGPELTLDVDGHHLRLEGPASVVLPAERRWPGAARAPAAESLDGARVLVRGLPSFGDGGAAGYRERTRIAVSLRPSGEALWIAAANRPRLRLGAEGWGWAAFAGLAMALLVVSAGGEIATARARAALAAGERDTAAEAAKLALCSPLHHHAGLQLLTRAWRAAGVKHAHRFERALELERRRDGRCDDTLALMLRHGLEVEVLEWAPRCTGDEAARLGAEAAFRLGRYEVAARLAARRSETGARSLDDRWLEARSYLLANQPRRAAASVRALAASLDRDAKPAHARRVLGCLADWLDPARAEEPEQKPREAAPTACNLLGYDQLERPRERWIRDIVLDDAAGDLAMVADVLRADDEPAAAAERPLPFQLPADVALGRVMRPVHGIAIDRRTAERLQALAEPTTRERQARLRLSLRLAIVLAGVGDVKQARRHLGAAAGDLAALTAEDAEHDPARARSRMALLQQAMEMRAGEVVAGASLAATAPGDERLAAELAWLADSLAGAPITVRRETMPTMDVLGNGDPDGAMTHGGEPLWSMLREYKPFLSLPIAWVAAHRLRAPEEREMLARFVRHHPTMQPCPRLTRCGLAEIAAERHARGSILERLENGGAARELEAAARMRAALLDGRFSLPLAIMEQVQKELHAAALPDTAGG